MKLKNRFKITFPAVAFFISVFFVLAATCALSEIIPQAGSVKGTVTVADTGAPVPGATVTVTAALLTFTATTDDLGAFTIVGVPAGNGLSATVMKAGYRTTAFSVTVRAGESSDVLFALPGSYLRLVYPNGGESIFAGSEVPIRWESAGIDSLAIDFSINGGSTWMRLEDAVDARPGVYIWDVQDIPSPTYRIRITDTDDSDISDMSDGVFRNSSI